MFASKKAVDTRLAGVNSFIPAGGYAPRGTPNKGQDLERFPAPQIYPPSHRRADYTTPAPKIPEHLVKNFCPQRRPTGLAYAGKTFLQSVQDFRVRACYFTSCRRDGGQIWSAGKGGKSEDQRLVLFVMCCRCPCPVGNRHLPEGRRQEPERWRGQRRLQCSKRLRR